MPNISKKVTRDNLIAMQNELLSLPEDERVELEVNHVFAPGVYCREALIPSGIAVVGKIHKHAHVNIISSGTVVVATEEGVTTFKAPHTFVSLPGTKRVCVALEDTIWSTIHPTDTTDLTRIEEEVIAKSYEEYDVYTRLIEG